MIRTLLVDIDVPEGDPPTARWSSDEFSTLLSGYLGQYVHVWGQIDASAVDAAWRKLRQLSRETEQGASEANRVHSAHKALSFWREVWPSKWWEIHRIGSPRSTSTPSDGGGS